MTPRRYQQRGLTVGLITTTLTALCFLLGVFEPIENLLLDLRQVYFNRLDVDPRIVHVDYDDGTLERMGTGMAYRRDFIAGLIKVLEQLGAKAVAVDILFLESQRGFVDDPALARDPGGLEEPMSAAGSMPASTRPVASPPTSSRPVVFPDLELARTMRAANNVYLGVAPQFDDDLDEQGRLDPGQQLGLAALVEILKTNFALDGPALETAWRAEMLVRAKGKEPLGYHQILARAKREAAIAIISPVLESAPLLHLPEVLARLSLDKGVLSRPDYLTLRDALQQARGRVCMLPKCPLPTQPVTQLSVIQEVSAPPVPYWMLADTARGFGAVTVKKDRGDKAVLRVPVMLRIGDRVMPHMGLALAADALGLDLANVRQVGGALEVRSPAGDVRRMPVDERGQLLLHWSPSDRHYQFTDRHIPALVLREVQESLEALEQNERTENARLMQLLGFKHRLAVVRGVQKHQGFGVIIEAAIELYSATQHRLRHDQLSGRTADQPELVRRLGLLRAFLDEELDRFAIRLRTSLKDFADDPPTDPRDVADYQTDLAHESDLRELMAIRERNAATAPRVLHLFIDLARRIRNKYVFIGLTATGEDRHPTAIHTDLPGVIAHSTLLNNILQDRFIHSPPRNVEILLVLLFGTLATVITATSGLRTTVLVVGSMLVGYSLINMGLLFRLADVKVELVAPLAATLAAAVPVMFYRWWTADTQRREIRSQLGSYTSPALANRIADDPQAVEVLTRVENRDVTCFFSDLKGFTTMAEQVENPERVKNVLNVYLDGMSEVLFQHKALINKFMGDGIFAFFNSTVLPLPNHPRQACEASLACMQALEQLRAQQRDKGGDELIQQFHMRIGLASGIAGVGDFGSTRKKDYTVIGDVANLAARLEPANKVFGTSLMISGPTRDAVKDAFEFRYLAELQVKGKHRTVPVYELLGRKGMVPDQTLEYAKRFGDGVELYKERRWDECMRHFTRMLVHDPDDVGLSAYIDASQEKKLFPPNDKWAGALELKEK